MPAWVVVVGKMSSLFVFVWGWVGCGCGGLEGGGAGEGEGGVSEETVRGRWSRAGERDGTGWMRMELEGERREVEI